MPRFDFQEIVDRLPLVVYIDNLDDQSSPLYVSPEIERLLGYTREEWLADPDLFQKSLHPDDRTWVMAEVERRNRSQAPVRYGDYRLIARDGSVVWVRDDEVIISAQNGSPAVACSAVLGNAPLSDTESSGMPVIRKPSLVAGFISFSIHEPEG